MLNSFKLFLSLILSLLITISVFSKVLFFLFEIISLFSFLLSPLITYIKHLFSLLYRNIIFTSEIIPVLERIKYFRKCFFKVIIELINRIIPISLLLFFVKMNMFHLILIYHIYIFSKKLTFNLNY